MSTAAPAYSNGGTSAIELGAVYTGDVFRNFSGGIRRGSAYLDNLDLQIGIDADALWGLRDTRFFVYGLYNNGHVFSPDIVGDLQAVSNIETDARAFRLYEAWFNVGVGRRSETLFGLYDLNSEFDVLETSQLFLGSAHGIGTDISQAGVNGPSIFPATSLALRYAVQLGEEWLVRVAVMDGVPGDPGHPGRTKIHLSAAEGALAVGEMQWQRDSSRVLLGLRGYTARFEEDPLDIDVPFKREARGNSGVYVRGETVLYESSSTVSAFARYGFAVGGFNVFSHFLGAGITWASMLPERPDDVVGLANAFVAGIRFEVEAWP